MILKNKNDPTKFGNAIKVVTNSMQNQLTSSLPLCNVTTEGNKVFPALIWNLFDIILVIIASTRRNIFSDSIVFKF